MLLFVETYVRVPHCLDPTSCITTAKTQNKGLWFRIRGSRNTRPQTLSVEPEASLKTARNCIGKRDKAAVRVTVLVECLGLPRGLRGLGL